jgi:MoxR-like ATPase
MKPRDQILDLKQRISRSIIGQDAIIERLLIGLLANGNLLVEGLPGLAKTRAVKSLAKNIDAGLSRIQFTPDLLPSDITGTEVYHQNGGRAEFRFEQGPIFNNLVLADEINRAPAKVQAALLEAMEERHVTVAGKTHKLPPLFLVMATQNPIEQEGTYPLPEAQLDRFLMHVLIGYPDETAEGEIVRLVRSEEDTTGGKAAATEEEPPVPQQAVFDARKEIHAVTVAPAMEKYIVDLVFATRYPERYGEDLRKWIQIGASPRGGLALDRCSRAHAWLQGRDHVTPDDVRAVVHDCLRHRVSLSYEATAAGLTAETVVTEILKVVAVA